MRCAWDCLAYGVMKRSQRPKRLFGLVGAGEDEVTVASGGGVVAIPYADIKRSNLVGD